MLYMRNQQHFTNARAAGRLVTIRLRIEGADSTIFEGPITTSGHEVTLPNGATYHGTWENTFESFGYYFCLADGKVKRRQKISYPTPIAALDDAARLDGFTWDGKVSCNAIVFSPHTKSSVAII